MNELMNTFENLSGPGTKTLKKLVEELISESSDASSKWNHTLAFVWGVGDALPARPRLPFRGPRQVEGRLGALSRRPCPARRQYPRYFSSDTPRCSPPPPPSITHRSHTPFFSILRSHPKFRFYSAGKRHEWGQTSTPCPCLALLHAALRPSKIIAASQSLPLSLAQPLAHTSTTKPSETPTTSL